MNCAMNQTSNATSLRGHPWDTCDHLTSSSTAKAVDSTVNCGLIPAVTLLLGIPGNVLCLCVFWKQGARERVNVLLFSLAVADLAKVLVLPSVQAGCFLSLLGLDRDAANWMSALRYQVAQYYRYFNFVSTQLTALMALDRALSVSLPLTAHRILSFGRMLSAILTIYTAALVLFLPMFLLYTTRWTVDPSTNTTIAVMVYRSNYSFHPDVPKNIIAILTGVLVPTSVFIVMISSVLVVVKLAAAMKTRRQMTNSQSESGAGESEAKITNMVLSVCFLYIALMLPETIVTLVNYALPEFEFRGCYHNTFSVFVRIMSLFSCLNSSVNFIAYVSLSAKFRTTLLQILRCSSIRRAKADTSKPGVSSTSTTRLTGS